jgi:hypothetical protein
MLVCHFYFGEVMVEAKVVDKEHASVWIDQVELLRQTGSGTLVFLVAVSAARFSFNADCRDGIVRVRVGPENAARDDWQSEVVLSATGDDAAVLTRAWWYFARSSGLGMVVVMDKHHWLRAGASEILYKSKREKRSDVA